MRGTAAWARGVGLWVSFFFGCSTGRAIGEAGDAGDAGQPDTDTGGERGGPDIVRPTNFDWGTVDIRIADTQSTPTGMTVKVVDQGSPPTLDTTLQFPSSTVPSLTDGASVKATHGDSLYQIEMYSCADIGHTRTFTPGCLSVLFDEKGGVTGNFIHPTGVGCDIKSGEASIQMPSIWDGEPGPADAGPPPPDVAVGTFVLACLGSGGTDLRLEGTFAVPARNGILLVSESTGPEF